MAMTTEEARRERNQLAGAERLERIAATIMAGFASSGRNLKPSEAAEIALDWAEALVAAIDPLLATEEEAEVS